MVLLVVFQTASSALSPVIAIGFRLQFLFDALEGFADFDHSSGNAPAGHGPSDFYAEDRRSRSELRSIRLLASADENFLSVFSKLPDNLLFRWTVLDWPAKQVRRPLID